MELPLSKKGVKVAGAFIIFNCKEAPTPVKAGTTQRAAKLELTPNNSFEVRAACKGFPVLSKNDALVCASLKDPKTGRFTVLSSTERVP